MKIVEKILVGLTLLGLIIKLTHWPGGNMLIILGLSTLTLFYPVAAYFLFSPKKNVEVGGMTFTQTSAPRVIFSLGTGFCLPLAVIGLLFKLMHWPGASVMLLVGFITIIPIAVVSVIQYSRKKDDFYKQIAIRSIIIGSLAILMFVFLVMPLAQKG